MKLDNKQKNSFYKNSKRSPKSSTKILKRLRLNYDLNNGKLRLDKKATNESTVDKNSLADNSIASSFVGNIIIIDL